MGLLKMDFYRMRKSYSTYIVLGVWVIFNCIMYLMMFGTETAGDPEFSAITYNMSSYFHYTMSGDLSIVFVTIISAIFVHSEIVNGSIKNIYGKETHKYKLILSKISVISIFIFVMFLLAAVASVIANIIHDDSLTLGIELTKLLKFTLVQFVLNIAFSSVVICLGTILRSNVVTLIAGIVYCTWGRMIETFIDGQIQKISVLEDFTLSNYVILGNLYSINFESSVEDVVRAIIVAVVITIISVVSGSFFLQKSDIK